MVFKIGDDVEEDKRTYDRLKYNRKINYAKIYWITKRCLLQKKCDKITWDKKRFEEHIKEKRKHVKILQLYDYRKKNLGMLDGEIYAFDLKERPKK